LQPEVIHKMTEMVAHRGPDGAGTAFLSATGERCTSPSSDNWRIALGHRRLSILDLSDAGAQPMSYRDRYWITYNGELYNYLELRAELESLGHQFKSHSDTEVLLASYNQWGGDCFRRFRGMWGLVLVDGRRGVAVVSRDHLGIKPLYVARHGNTIALVSEIKQLAALPGFSFRADRQALWEYVLTGDEESHRTLFADISPIPPGTWSEIDLQSGQQTEPTPFWFPETVKASVTDPHEAASLFRETIMEATRIELRSDVPVGCALSGGLDSSALAVCANQLLQGTGGRMHTFSVVFPGHPRDESQYINIVANEIHAHSHPITPSAETLLQDLDRFVWIHDEPVGGLAQYASYVVARLMQANKVPVTLNGQGGDEILGGYWQSYFVHMRRELARGRVGRVVATMAGSMSKSGNGEFLRQIPVMLRRYRHRKNAAHRWQVRGDADVAARQVSQKFKRLLGGSDQDRRVYEIREIFLPRLLKWDDRNLMAFGIEGRYPLLDPKMIEVALSFAPNVLYSRGWTKEPLRRGLSDLLPPAITRRRTKFGFPTPQVEWIFGPLRPVLQAFVDGDSPLWEVMEKSQVAQFADRVWADGGKTENLSFELFRIFLIDRWMRTFSVT
jgi:asparagine synthase (glutamine-hydrolysing)